MSRQISYSYIYYLQAVKQGKFVIPHAKFKLKDKEYFSDSLHIEVTGNLTQNQAGVTGNNNSTDNTIVEYTGSEIFVTLSINRKEVYQSEHIVATV